MKLALNFTSQIGLKSKKNTLYNWLLFNSRVFLCLQSYHLTKENNRSNDQEFLLKIEKIQKKRVI